MNTDVWLNLYYRDLVKSRRFFVDIGFDVADVPQNPKMFRMIVGANKLVVCMFDEAQMQLFSGNHTVVNTGTAFEVLISLGAASPNDVDKLADRVEAAGGKLYARPGWKDGWMYGCGFIDLDGHRWNPLFLDFEKLKKS